MTLVVDLSRIKGHAVETQHRTNFTAELIGRGVDASSELLGSFGGLTGEALGALGDASDVTHRGPGASLN